MGCSPLEPIPLRHLTRRNPAIAAPACLQAPAQPPISQRFRFEEGFSVDGNAAISLARVSVAAEIVDGDTCIPAVREEMQATGEPAPSLSSLKPLGQISESFILAVNHDGLWIIDQHVAHERVLFERILRQRTQQKVDSQRLLMPLVFELTPAQQAMFAEISEELNQNGFEAEPFGTRSIAVKVSAVNQR